MRLRCCAAAPQRVVEACAEGERQPVFPECTTPSLRDKEAVRAEVGPERHR